MTKVRLAIVLLLPLMLVSGLACDRATEETPTATPTPSPTPTSITFPDPNLEAVIRELINKPTSDIYDSDLVGLTDLDASERAITDLTGLEYCADLTWVYLSQNQISDISTLSSLTSLTGLDLAWNQISDISPLSSLASLTYLGLGGNHVSDMESLVDNTGLSSGDYVDLWDNPLSCTSVCTYIPQLEARGVTVYCDIRRLEGDINYDGIIDSADFQLVAQGLVGTITLTGYDFLAADVNDSVTLDSADLQLVAQYLVGTITAFPGGTYIPYGWDW